MNRHIKNLRQQIIFAQFGNEQLTLAVGPTMVYRARATKYYTLGSIGRLAEQLWFGFIFLLFLAVSLGITIILGTAIKHGMSTPVGSGLVKTAALLLFWLFCIYQTLLCQAYLRWMIKNRSKNVPNQ